jgi:hypothetical protein
VRRLQDERAGLALVAVARLQAAGDAFELEPV